MAHTTESGISIIAGIAVGSAAWVFQAYVFSLAWGCFIEPLCHFPLSFYQAFGVVISYGVLVGFKNRKREYETTLDAGFAALISTFMEWLVVVIMRGVING